MEVRLVTRFWMIVGAVTAVGMAIYMLAFIVAVVWITLHFSAV